MSTRRAVKMAGQKTTNGWDDDNYDIVIQCQSVYGLVFFSP